MKGIFFTKEKYPLSDLTGKIEDVHFAQTINYLETCKMGIGLLINFGSRILNLQRVMKKNLKAHHEIRQIKDTTIPIFTQVALFAINRQLQAIHR